MARTSYQYETSPRKILPDYSPDYNPKKQPNKQKKTKRISKEQERQKQLALKQEKRKHHKNIALILGVFLVLLAISYRNSLINESFNENEKLKSNLAAIQKENEQLKVNLENSLNLSNIEKMAEKKLGMQKLDNSQKVYVSLDKQDYVEPASEEVVIEEEKNWIEQLLDKLLGK